MGPEKTIEEQIEERLQRARDNIATGNDIPEVVEPATEVDLVYRPGCDAEVMDHQRTAIKLLEYAESMTINTLEASKLAVSDLASIATCKKAMEAKRKEYLSPHQDIVKDIQLVYKEIMAPVERAEQILKGKQLAFLTEQARLRALAEEVNRKANELAQAEMKATGELSQSVVEVEPVSAPKAVHGAIGTSGMVDHWTFEITDPIEVPREYLIVDQAMLSMIAKKYHDGKPIGGIRFYNKPYLATRA